MTKLHVAGAAMALALGFGGSALAEDTGREGQQGEYGQQAPSQEQGIAEEEGAQQQQQGQQPSEPMGQAWSLDQLSKEQTMDLQRELKSRGHYQGKVDGIAGPMTRAAIRDFQQREDLGGDGQLNQETVSALGIDLERQPVAGQEATEGEARTEMKSFQLSRLSKDQVKELQTKLKESGHYKGKVDGVIGGQTRSALQAFFRRQGDLASRGMVSESGLTGFGLDASEIERVGGEERQGEMQRQQPERPEGWTEEQQQEQQQQEQQREQQREQQQEPERQQQPEGTGTEPPSPSQ